MPWQTCNLNPFGKHVGDCVVRALSLALDQDWDTTYLELMSQSDLENVYKMVDIIKDVSTIEAMRDAGYSQANVRMNYDDPSMSYARYGNRSYDDGYSERRGRDAMGRYTSRDGYSMHNESMIDMLKDKMHNATNEVERENYRRVIEQLER